MVCIPGGAAVIGSDDGAELERPRHTVEISTFYIDQREVDNAAYAACEDAGACPRRLILPEASFMAPDQPALPLTWRMAHAYCLWVGKRLPSEAEWEKAARGGEEGRRFPWGDDEPTCQLAQTLGCSPATTVPVGSLPAGAYGIHEMAGNGFEWVQDWASACYDGCVSACGAACLGLDPAGPCAGASTCRGHELRVLKGGSWFWPAEHARSARRRPQKMSSGLHRLGVRCASSHLTLATWPPRWLTQAATRPADTKPPDAIQLAAFSGVRQEHEVAEIPPCGKVHEARHDCRDPQSYIVSNEPDQYLFEPLVRNRGGGYVGIGADQSYSLIASARSRWAWVFDYDPAVVRLHWVLRALVLESSSATELVDALSPDRVDAIVDATTRSLEEESEAGLVAPDDLEPLRAELDSWLRPLQRRYRARLAPASPELASFDWLANPDRYRYVRALYQQGRILIRKGNLLTDVVLPDIARAARSLGVAVRVLYTSNADDQWDITRTYRASLLGLPFDADSIALRTTLAERRDPRDSKGWDYVVHHGLDFQRSIARPEMLRIRWLNQQGRRQGHLLTIALPGAE